MAVIPQGQIFSHTFHLIARDTGKPIFVAKDKETTLSSHLWAGDHPDPKLLSMTRLVSQVPVASPESNDPVRAIGRVIGMAEGIVVIQRTARSIVGVKSGSQNILWETHFEKNRSIERGFLVKGNLLFAHESCGKVECRSLQDGSILGKWSVPESGWVSFKPKYRFEFFVGGTDFLAFGLSSGDLNAQIVRLEGSDLRVKYAAPLNGSCWPNAYLWKNELICRAIDLQMVDLDTGKITATISTDSFIGEVAGRDSLLWFHERHAIICFDLARKKKVWEYGLPRDHFFENVYSDDGSVVAYVGGAQEVRYQTQTIYVEAIEREAFGSTLK